MRAAGSASSARRRDERGSLAPAMPILALMLFLLGGLGIDGARLFNARSEALAYAEEAARAGAVHIDEDASFAQVDEPAARGAVEKYCATLRDRAVVDDCRFVRVSIGGRPGEPQRPFVVETHVRLTIDTTLLQIIDVDTLTTTADAKAQPEETTVLNGQTQSPGPIDSGTPITPTVPTSDPPTNSNTGNPSNTNSNTNSNTGSPTNGGGGGG